MGECKEGTFIHNMVVTHGAISCYGGFGYQPCKYLQECMDEYHLKLKGKRIVKDRNK